MYTILAIICTNPFQIHMHTVNNCILFIQSEALYIHGVILDPNTYYIRFK